MELDRDKLLEIYRRMLMIRRFEEQTWNVYTKGLMAGLAHLYIGEEAVAAKPLNSGFEEVRPEGLEPPT